MPPPEEMLPYLMAAAGCAIFAWLYGAAPTYRVVERLEENYRAERFRVEWRDHRWWGKARVRCLQEKRWPGFRAHSIVVFWTDTGKEELGIPYALETFLREESEASNRSRAQGVTD